MQIKQLRWIRQLTSPGIPDFGARLYQAFRSIQTQATNYEKQANLNPQGLPYSPPNIQSVVATGQNGVLHATITDQSAGVTRPVEYTIEHADNPSFQNAQVRFIGASRSFTEFIGNGTRYVRAYSGYPNSSPSNPVYHGGTTPAPVNGGGSIGPPMYMPSQGSGTGAAGQSGVGRGPVLERNQSNSFNWTTNQAYATAGFNGQGTAAGINASAQTSGGGGGSPILPGIIYDTYANWTSSNYPPNAYAIDTQFVITDWNFVTYIVRSVAGSNTWVYESGAYSVTQSAIPTHGYNAASLNANDAGLLVNVTDYAHVLKWGGSSWGWGPGESGSGYFADFAVAPTGSGWHACDGSSGVKYLKADGTTGTVTVPSTASTPAYRKSASTYSATISAAATPTVTINAITPSGTNSAPTLAMNSYTPAGTISGPTFTGAAATLATTNFLTTGGTTPAIVSISGSNSTYTPSGLVSAPVFAGTPATLTGTVTAPTFTGNSVTPTGTISLSGGDPVANYQAITYFRV